MGRRALAALAAFLWLLPARAAEVSGHLAWGDPALAAAKTPFHAVVYLTGFSQPPPPDTPVIVQRNKTFLPDLLAIVAGQSVRFTNDDNVLHNVFSTSRARQFDLGKPGPGEARDVRFEKTGIVNVYCNIHEKMAATILVLPNRAFALVGADGRFRITGVPPGTYSLFVWGKGLTPYQTQVTVAEGAPAHLSITVRRGVFFPSHLDKFGRSYKDRKGYPR